MNFISVFSGGGGLDLGLVEAGLEHRLSIDSDEDCRKTLRLNRPDWHVPDAHGGDLTKFTPEEILALSGLDAGELDVIAGGPPCQSFSTIGNRRGYADPRGKLSLTYLKLISALAPRFFVFENVAGFLEHNSLLRRFSDLKAHDGRTYSIEARLINAAEYGVPQVRKRLFIIGTLEGNTFQFPRITHTSRLTSNADGLLPFRTAGEALALATMELQLRPDNRVMKHSDLMIERMSHIRIGENFKALPNRLRPPCWKNGKHQGTDTFGRIDPSKPSVTIRCSAFNPTKGRYIHPRHNRGLSIVEMAMLQTFPPDYVFVGSMVSAGRQIGNAVPPALATHIGSALLASD